MANLLTLARVGLIFLIVAVWEHDARASWPALDLLMVPLLAWAIFMDALDGWAARRWNEESEAGALFDIAGDRIVELTLWVFFATRRDALGEPLVALWVPMALITRTVLTDFVRSVAFGQGRTPFGPASLQTSRWARRLTASRWSRGAYGIAKAASFCALGLLLARRGAAADGEAARMLRLGVDALVHLTVVFSIVRAVPVLWDGHRLLLPLTRAGSAVATPRPSR
jgi:CDP-diacylglycerol---glycerol-3-phosphate 3-phosphatidyltransferase